MPLEEAAAPLVALIRRFRPQVITTYDERGGYPHPDHIKTHEISVHAFEAAGDPDRYPELGRALAAEQALLPHELHACPGRKALHEAILAAGVESPYTEWLENWDPAHDISHRVTTRVPCAEYFAVRDAALLAHATQIDPHGRWFACPMDAPAARSGRPRTTSWPGPWSNADARGRPVRRHAQRGGRAMTALDRAGRGAGRPAARRTSARPARSGCCSRRCC